MKMLSLFSGIGGIDIAAQWAGIETVAFCEIDKFCQKVLAKHWPNVPIFDDVRTLTKQSLSDRGIDPESISMVAGGFPCQDVSVAGRQAGIDGERSGLWRQMHRIVCELRPRYVLVENVAGLLAGGLGRVLGDLAASGYDAEWDCIPAAEVGAIHKRERVFIVAHPDAVRKPQSQGRKQDQWGGFHYGTQAGNNSPDDRTERVQRFIPRTLPQFEAFSWCKDVRRVEDLRNRPDIPEPLFRGSSDGIPHWMDRIGSIGNAVMPAQVYPILKAIVDL